MSVGVVRVWVFVRCTGKYDNISFIIKITFLIMFYPMGKFLLQFGVEILQSLINFKILLNLLGNMV